MKILHVSHQQYKYLGARNYLLPVRINNGFVRDFHEVYWFSDRDVARASSWFHTRSTGIGACNRKFLQSCRNLMPDVIALCSADILSPETIAEARRIVPHAAIFQYYTDTLSIERNFANVTRKKDVVDMTFVTTAGDVLKRLTNGRSRAAFYPNPVDPSIDTHKCHERDDLTNDIFFAGHIGGDWQDTDNLRNLAYEIIRANFPQARTAFHSQDIHGYLYGADFIRVMTDSRIGLNFSQKHRGSSPGPGGDMYMYSSDRIGLYQGNGLLLFCTNEFNLSELYGADTMVEVSGEADFVDKLRYYLENDSERKRIAEAGYELAHREFNERLVSRYMIEATLGLPFTHDYRWPTTVY